MKQVEEIGRTLDLMESAIAARVARVDAAGEVRAWGHPSTAAWLRVRLGIRHGRATERVLVARQLRRIPETAKRLARGELAYGYVTAIAEGVKRVDDADLDAAERILRSAAEGGASVKDVDRIAARILDVIADRDGHDPRSRRERRGFRRSWLQVSPDFDGRGAYVTGWLTGEHASLLRQACEPLAKPAGAGDGRDHAQRFAEALASRLSGGGQHWSATLVVDLDPGGAATAATGPGCAGLCTAALSTAAWPGAARSGRSGRARGGSAPFGDASSAWAQSGAARFGAAQSGAAQSNGTVADAGSKPAGADGLSFTAGSNSVRRAKADSLPPATTQIHPGMRFAARTVDGFTISREDAWRIMENAGISTLLLGSGGMPLYLGRRTRLVQPAQRRALLARYESCAFDGCEIPAYLCEIDHVVPWWPTGRTDIDNLAPLCGFHNRYKFEKPGRVITQRHSGGRWRYRVVGPFHG